jgi:16S rRNA (guanine527-N7)-methyltransferase
MTDDTASLANSTGNDGLPPANAPEPVPDEVMPLLRVGAAQMGLPLTDEQVRQFEAYCRLLVEWNERFNLTAITDYADVQVKHFLDCLAGWPYVLEEVGATHPLSRPLHLADVGTGAGFPGVPLKIVAPRLKLTLIDGTGKKVQFLRHVVEALGLRNTEVVQGRAEELGHNNAFRGQYDLVAARAVAPMNTLAEYLLPLVRRGGFAVVYKGAAAGQEFVEARAAIEMLGGETTRMAPARVPFLDEGRFVLLLKKVRPTPGIYPRGQGLARKKPLE